MTGTVASVFPSTLGRFSLGIESAAWQAGSLINLATVANQARIIPLLLPEPILVRKVFWHTNTASSGNVDVGLYDQNYQKIFSTGSVAIGAVSVLVENDITDIVIDRGSYYIAIATSGSGVNQLMGTAISNLSALSMMGVGRMESAMPLPSLLTPLSQNADAGIPYVGLAQRTLAA